jgi:hypothetical protein
MLSRLIRRIIKFLRRLFNVKTRANPLPTLEVILMSADVLLSWPSVPTTRTDGSPMSVDYISLEAQVDGASSWTEIAQVPPSELQRLVSNVATGTWNFRGTVVPTTGDPSVPVEATLVVPESAASPLPTLLAELQ